MFNMFNTCTADTRIQSLSCKVFGSCYTGNAQQLNYLWHFNSVIVHNILFQHVVDLKCSGVVKKIAMGCTVMWLESMYGNILSFSLSIKYYT